jgi:hypothetical protein
MNKRRDNLLLSGGLLIGFGAGLCVGLLLLIAAIPILLHHMFIMGIQWTSPGFYLFFIGLPLSLISTGLVALRRAGRVVS